jgi:hypothetical protein
VQRVSLRPVAKAENRGFAMVTMPNAAEAALLCAFYCFPPASPAFAPEAGKLKTAPKDRSKRVISFRKSGAGEGIRTLDPNLGKVASGWLRDITGDYQTILTVDNSTFFRAPPFPGSSASFPEFASGCFRPASGSV